MRSSLMVVLIILSVCTSQAQQWSVESTIGISYSGINHTLRGSYLKNQFEVGIGPKANYSKAYLPWSSNPGISLLLGYDVIATTMAKTQVMLLYEVLPIQAGTIHEVYAGYRMHYSLKERWKVQNTLGVGGYNEASNQSISYSINGLSYCVNVGLSYRL